MIRGNAATHGVGWDIKQVEIRELDATRRIARCVDTEGQWLDVATAIHRTGIRLQVGQVWLADRELSAWTLRALLEFGAATPVPAFTSAWQPLKLSNDWIPSTGTTDPAPSARVTADGMVELSGVMSGGTVPAVGVTLTVGQLPAGFPGVWRVNAILASSLPAGATGYVRGAVTATGAVTISVSTAYTPPWIDLSALRARVA